MSKNQQLKFIKEPNSFSKIKEELDNLLNDKTLKFAIFSVFSLLILTIVLLIIFWNKLPPQLPLFYSKPWGKEQLAKKVWFLSIPFICFSVVILNLRLACLFFKKEILLTKMLVWTTVILALLTSITIIKVLFIVI